MTLNITINLYVNDDLKFLVNLFTLFNLINQLF